MGTISRVGTWHSPLSSARNSCWSCSLVGSEFDLVPVCFVEDSISFILFLAWWPRNAACILVAAFSLSFSVSSSFFSPPFDSASFFSFESADCLFCDDSCESTFAGLLSAFVISENLSIVSVKMDESCESFRFVFKNFLKIKYIYRIIVYYPIYGSQSIINSKHKISWTLYKYYSYYSYYGVHVHSNVYHRSPRDLIIDIEMHVRVYYSLWGWVSHGCLD